MPDILVESLSREQIDQLNKVLQVFDPPTEAKDTIEVLMVLKAAEVWYLERQRKFRMEERGG